MKPGTGRNVIDLKVPPLLLAAIFAALMWLVAQALPSIPLSAGVRLVLVVLLAAVAVPFLVFGVHAFRRAGTTVNPTRPGEATELVTSGVYKYTRNPMYVGMLIALVAWGVWLSSLFAIAAVAGFIWYMNRFQIGPEEKALEVLFGSTYTDYKSRVRRWL